jgi:hypothetical protein
VCVCVCVCVCVRARVRMRGGGGCPALHFFFPHYTINVAVFGKKSLIIKCVFRFSLQILSETFLILRRTEQDIVKNVYWSSCKVALILIRIYILVQPNTTFF